MKYEVYEEDKHGNTWRVATFSTKEAAEFYRKRLFEGDEAYKTRETK